MLFLIYFIVASVSSFSISSISCTSVNWKVERSYAFLHNQSTFQYQFYASWTDARTSRSAPGISMLHFLFKSKYLSARTIHFSFPCPIRYQGSTNILSCICSCPWTNGSWEVSVYPVFFKYLSFIPIPFLAIT